MVVNDIIMYINKNIYYSFFFLKIIIFLEHHVSIPMTWCYSSLWLWIRMASSLEALCFFFDRSKTSAFKTGHADEYAGLNCILKISGFWRFVISEKILMHIGNKRILKISHFRKTISCPIWSYKIYERILTIISTVRSDWSAKSSDM